jgi:hypothetical protein
MEKSTEEELVELFNKENCTFKRYGLNKYLLEYFMENKNIYMEKIIDFSLIQLIYNLNHDGLSKPRWLNKKIMKTFLLKIKLCEQGIFNFG